MIAFHVVCRAQPGKQSEIEAALVKLVASVQDIEEQAVFYTFFWKVDAPDELVLLESYTDNDAFLAHHGIRRLECLANQVNGAFAGGRRCGWVGRQ